MFFMCPKHTDFPLELIAVGWSWQMLNCLLMLFSAALSQTALCLFPFPGFFLQVLLVWC